MNTEKYKKLLVAEKAQAEEDISLIGKKDEHGDWDAVPETEIINQEVPDEADMAERSEDYEERTARVNFLEKKLTGIEKALEKIEKGEYGVCEVCGDKIDEDRLDVNPSAATCTVCMNKV
jgi:DnaK suppressor protein